MFVENQDKIEKRVFRRTSFKEPISYLFTDPEDDVGGCLGSDLSERGLCVNFNRFVRPKTDMVFKFRLSGASDVLMAKGRVVWAHRVPCSDRYQLGIEFEETNTRVQEDIRQYVGSHIK
ncbi:MAG: PilZ domain-containing protein [Candidatus Omnitrophica bacterium]|nr:PilZ domain-containing protein [Candidatus Omnitrophota bacterium]